MTHDEANDKLTRIFAANRCDDDSLKSDVRALWYADVEELEGQVQDLQTQLLELREGEAALKGVKS